jgi:hypothetical protein
VPDAACDQVINDVLCRLVQGMTVADPAGMARIRHVMGVCPQARRGGAGRGGAGRGGAGRGGGACSQTVTKKSRLGGLACVRGSQSALQTLLRMSCPSFLHETPAAPPHKCFVAMFSSGRCPPYLLCIPIPGCCAVVL